jgi:diaminopimelate decarboxylase
MAIELGMRITLDHMDDLVTVERLGKEYGRPIQTLIRVKSDMASLQDLQSTFYPGVTVPLEVLNYKFGVTYNEAVEIAEAASKSSFIEIDGIHSHIGRDLHLPEHWKWYAYDMIKLCSQFKTDTGIEPGILDLGGGFAEIRDPSSHNLNELAASAEEYAEKVCEGIRQGCREFDFPLPRLWVEPGRHLIGSTTVMISRVGNVKRTPGVCTWVHTDASTNFLSGAIRHNGMSYHLLAGTKARDKAVETVDIVGPNCAGDLIQPRRKMPELKRGDLIIFLDVGAYNAVYANQFNCIPRPASVLVSGKTADIVCERESLQDVFAHQQIPARLLAG